MVISENELIIFGEKSQPRTIVYVTKTVDAMTLASRQAFSGEFHNLGRDESNTLLEAVLIIEDELKTQAKISFEEA